MNSISKQCGEPQSPAWEINTQGKEQGCPTQARPQDSGPRTALPLTRASLLPGGISPRKQEVSLLQTGDLSRAHFYPVGCTLRTPGTTNHCETSGGWERVQILIYNLQVSLKLGAASDALKECGLLDSTYPLSTTWSPHPLPSTPPAKGKGPDN